MCSEGRGRSARDCPFVIAQIAGVLPRRVSFVPSQTLGTEALLVPPRPYPFWHRAPVLPVSRGVGCNSLLKPSLCSQGDACIFLVLKVMV